MSQVVIIGAGPAGSTLAMLLAQRGVNVTLVEASRSFRRIFRGEALMPSGLDAITQMGLADVVKQIPHRALDAWAFYLEKRLLFRVDEPFESGGQPCTLISQPAFLEAVLANASQHPNFQFIPGVALQELVWNDERVTGVKLSDGQVIPADLVIGADGRHSTVRQQAQLSLQEDPQDFDILWFKLPSSPELEQELAQQNIFYSMVYGRNAFGWFQGSEGNLQLGWSLHRQDSVAWQQLDWAKALAAASPDWLAPHFQSQKDALERPLLLSIIVGRAPSWHRPGLLILGDAAHPMSPIRAQGINMALRDAIVAANHLAPFFQSPSDGDTLDHVLPLIQAEREPEIINIQRLQRAEIAQARLLRHYPLLRHSVSRLAPVLGGKIRQSWLARQVQLRQGVSPVHLKV
jgi:2-polyprenyl-6-methoxyphenol hydroxylase-like FAD-dependent oxidoreductase